MKKAVKNRDVFIKSTILFVVVSLLVTAMICLVGCKKYVYDSNFVTVQFDKKQAVFTIPNDCTIRVEEQKNYYNFEEISPIKVKEMDGLVQYVFDNKKYEDKIFRIERDGYVTKAGYFANNGNYKIAYDSGQNLYERNEYVGNLPNGLLGIEDLMLTNVGEDYFKHLQIGEEFDLRLFRNNMIINNTSSNLEIEPNFDINADGDSVKLERVKENAFKVVAVNNGITTINIKYQAIEVLHKDGWFCYNASNQKRDVVLTFAVGDSYTKDIDFTINGKDFDSEFDTCYFQKDYGNVLLHTVGADNVICNGVKVNAVNDNYSLKIQEGANTVAIDKGGKCKITTIYGAKIQVVAEKVQDETPEIVKLKINVYGLYNILPKMSGIYNPTQKYDDGDSPTNGSLLLASIKNAETVEVVKAKYVSQYYYVKNSEILLNLKTEHLQNKELELVIDFVVEWWGSNLGAHRSISDNGISTNLDAKLNSKSLGIFEKVKISL